MSDASKDEGGGALADTLATPRARAQGDASDPALDDTATPAAGPAANPVTDPVADTVRGESDGLETGRMRAAARAKLFGGAPSPTRVGRHLIIDRLGAGGMGVVYAAYDPKLDRKIAVKLVQAANTSQAATDRLMREAQAMAKVSHRNVIAVFDVGTLDDDVYIAMEYIDGPSLRGWLRDADGTRSWNEILGVIVQAGEGLAAAHRAGLIHRDFKPDNAMVRSDGTVVVLDFGLARAGRGDTEPAAPVPTDTSSPLATPLTQTGTVVGTPAYMAPEQYLATDVDERADQFSFCVAAFEALVGRRPFDAATVAEIRTKVLSGEIDEGAPGKPVPPKILEALRRGLRTEPDERWGSMDELLAALRADPTRTARRLRWGLGSVVAVSIAGGSYGAYGNWQRSQCAEVGQAIASAWNDTARQGLRDRAMSLERAHLTDAIERAIPMVDRYATRWSALRTESCVAERIDETMPQALAPVARQCFDDRRAAAASRVALLSSADEVLAGRAVDLMVSLPAIEPCADETVLRRTTIPPPEVREGVQRVGLDLVDVQSLHAAGRYDAAVERARAAVDAARELGWNPLLARAEHRLGVTLKLAGEYTEAEATLQRGFGLAIREGDVDVAADAATALTFVVGSQLNRPAQARLWGQWALALLEYLGEVEGSRAGTAYAALGTVAIREGDLEGAREAMQRSLDLRVQALGPDHLDVGLSLDNLGIIASTLGHYDEALGHHERARELRARVLGPIHPEVAYSLGFLGTIRYYQARYEASVTAFKEALSILEQTVGRDHPEAASTLTNLGSALGELGEHQQAIDAYQRAEALLVAAHGADHPNVADTISNAAGEYYRLKAYPKALTEYRRALAIRRRASGQAGPGVGLDLNGLGNVQRATGDLDEAIASFQESVEQLETALDERHPSVAFALTGMGNALIDAERHREALVPLERAVRIRQGQADPRKLATSVFAQARAVWGAGDRTQARALAARAKQLVQSGESPDPALDATLTAWLAEHEG